MPVLLADVVVYGYYLRMLLLAAVLHMQCARPAGRPVQPSCDRLLPQHGP